MKRDPHVDYIWDVVYAIPTDLKPDWSVDDSETGTDGATMTLTAILEWDGTVSPDLYPHGLLLLWSLELGWRYARMRADGSNDWPDDLPVPLWAAPTAVAAAAAALLSGKQPRPCEDIWSDAEVMAAVKAWEQVPAG